jgi:hypothetical protein
MRGSGRQPDRYSGEGQVLGLTVDLAGCGTGSLGPSLAERPDGAVDLLDPAQGGLDDPCGGELASVDGCGDGGC